MKDLLKKGKKAPKPTKPKKALFGKPKKQATEPAQVTSKKPTKSMAIGQANTNKIIAILVVALVLILLALAAKLFLFNDDTVIDDIAVTAPVATVEPTVADESVTEPSNDELSQTEIAPESDTVITDTPVDSAVVVVPVENIETIEPVAPEQPRQELSYDEFIKETESKIYREHNTR